MPVNINLLPTELSVSKSLNEFIKTLRALGVIAVVVFLIFGIGVAAFFIISTVTLNGVNASVTRLKGQVAAQQTSEQQIILLKDRISKITSALSVPSSLPNQTLVQSLFSGFPAGISINQMQIDPGAIDLTVGVKTNSDISSFMAAFQDSDTFKSVDLTSFNFNPTSGYSVEVKAVGK